MELKHREVDSNISRIESDHRSATSEFSTIDSNLNEAIRRDEPIEAEKQRRIDNIIKFDNLNEEQIKTIIKNKIKNLKQKYKNKDINININQNVINEICDESEYKLMGARKIDKIIKDRVDNQIIDEVIKNNNKITIKTIKLTV